MSGNIDIVGNKFDNDLKILTDRLHIYREQLGVYESDMERTMEEINIAQAKYDMLENKLTTVQSNIRNLDQIINDYVKIRDSYYDIMGRINDMKSDSEINNPEVESNE